ncbi:MAG TPA: hypothetical protein VMS17_05010, partial [Gemmataceae bacterium]|nr:hypothetical protein [Gemmataceae bacterium]
MIEDLTQEELHAAADRLVEELLAAARVAHPPVDAAAAAQRHLKFTIREDARPAPSPYPLPHPGG